MKKFDARRVINGTFGEMWLDDEYMSEVTGLEAKVALEQQDVQQCGNFFKGTKIIGASGSGTVKALKATSKFTKVVSDCLKNKQFPAMTIISNLEDPDAFGAERVKLTGVVFDEISLANWEAAKTGEQSIPFKFSDYELLDIINV